MEQRTRELYLELLEKTLTYSFWDEPPVPFERIYARRKMRWRLFGAVLTRFLAAFDLRAVRPSRVREEDRLAGRVWPALAHTMVGRTRLRNVRTCVETVLREGVPGDLLEAGVWRGGTCIFMKGVLEAHGVHDRSLYVADSFAGLPPPDDERYPADRGDRLHAEDFLRASRDEVEDNFRAFGLLDDRVVFLDGWFRDTLRAAEIEALAILRLDADMYGSTMEALDPLYPRLSPGGFCIVDDYDLEACRRAVDDFRAARSIDEPLVPIDRNGVYWRKGT
jgi:O-methyltransferase